MEVLFLGTCAYDYSPKLQEEYKDCFDLDARRSSSMLIDGQYLVDCGDHCLEELRLAKVDFSAITDIFVTHLHRDHFSRANLEILAQGRVVPLKLWVRADAKVTEVDGVEIKRMENKVSYFVKENFSVTGLQANHDPACCPQHFYFEYADKKMLYACDGAWFLTDTYNFLKNKKLDFCVLDATCGDTVGEYRIAEHNTLPMLRLMTPSLKTVGIIDEHTQIYLSHIAPSLHVPHNQLQESVKKDGFQVAYDGLKIVF